MAVGGARVFPGFLTPELTQLSFQNHRVLFSHASAEVRGENTLDLNRVSNSQLLCHDSDTLTTEPPRRGTGSISSLKYFNHIPALTT